MYNGTSKRTFDKNYDKNTDIYQQIRQGGEVLASFSQALSAELVSADFF